MMLVIYISLCFARGLTGSIGACVTIESCYSEEISRNKFRTDLVLVKIRGAFVVNRSCSQDPD